MNSDYFEITGKSPGSSDKDCLLNVVLKTIDNSFFQDSRLLPLRTVQLYLFLKPFRPWRLLIRDDGSTDATPQLIEDAACQDPQRIRIMTDQDGNGVFMTLSLTNILKLESL